MRWLFGLAVGVVVAGAGCSRVEAAQEGPEDALRHASVTVAGRCAGVVLEDGRHVVTAAHCIDEREEILALELFDTTPVAARVLSVDRARDVAILGVDGRLPVRGLTVADEMPEAGTPVFFSGRVDWGGALQHVSVVRLGKCPSLPEAPAVLFTSLRGRKGDSGAPVVDESLRVVGLVHGGAACSIAAPTDHVPEMLQALINRS